MRVPAPRSALIFQMIYQQPVGYENLHIAPRVLLVVGAEDHVVPLGQYATPAELARLGDFVGLSEAVVHVIPLDLNIQVIQEGKT